MNKDKKETFGLALYVGVFVMLMGGMIAGVIYDEIQDKKYGKPRYEYVITDKYEEWGSTWHLIGGRSTEQEYRVTYRYRLSNRPDKERNLIWYEGDSRVSGAIYRKLRVGQTVYGNSSIFPY